MNNLALTGPSGVGKSFLLASVAGALRGRVHGFTSESIRDGARVLGWRLDGLSSGDGGVFLHRELHSRDRFGSFGIDFSLLERLVHAELRPGGELYLIDEIGKVCPRLPPFVSAVQDLLDGPSATLSSVHVSAAGFPARVRQRHDVTMLEVTMANRDTLRDQVPEWSESCLTRG